MEEKETRKPSKTFQAELQGHILITEFVTFRITKQAVDSMEKDSGGVHYRPKPPQKPRREFEKTAC